MGGGRRSALVAIAVFVRGVLSCASGGSSSPEGELPLPPRTGESDGGTVETDGGGGTELPPVDAGSDVVVLTGPRVFVTSASTNGVQIGGLAGADARCAAIAADAGIAGSWVAWLSVSGGPHAGDRLTSVGPWHTIGGSVVAANKGTLLGGTLAAPIDRDERGAVIAASRVWTGTGPDGRYLTNDCDKWTPGGNRGRVGASDQTAAAWTSSAIVDCDQLGRLYCFER